MKAFTKIALPVVALAAALISSCGGGDNERNGYVSLQQFTNGGRGFRFIGSPSADIVGGESFSGNYKFDKEMLDYVKDVVEVDDTLPKDEKKDGTVYVYGTVRSAGKTSNLQVVYTVEGGSSGRGFLYVTFQGADGMPESLVNLLGCVIPNQVTSATKDGATIITIQEAPPIVFSLYSAVLVCELPFESGMAKVHLCYQLWDYDTNQPLGFGSKLDVTCPYIPVDAGM